MYSRKSKQKEILEKAKQALERYENDVQDVSAGVQVLNYVDKKFYQLKKEHEKEALNMFMEWGIRKVDYVWLRLAHNKMLELKEE